MILLQVDMSADYHGLPHVAAAGGVAISTPMAPPSTIVGFLESMCGKRSGWFLGTKSSVAYGLKSKPKLSGTILRTTYTEPRAPKTDKSDSKDQPDPEEKPDPSVKKATSKKVEVTRPVARVVNFYTSYLIAVVGEAEKEVRLALDGKVKRYGVLSLGESDNMVNLVTEVPNATNALWLERYQGNGGMLLTKVAKQLLGGNNSTIDKFILSKEYVPFNNNFLIY